MNFKKNVQQSGALNRKSSRLGAFKDLDATELYCSRCKKAVPVRKRLLIVLPDGNKYEYLCAFCSETVGTKMDKNGEQVNIIV